MKEEILRLLGKDAGRVHLDIRQAVGSTNDLLRAAADDGAPEFTVIAARHQTAGKGRQGRKFYSPANTGLYLSMLFRPELPREALLSLTPMAAVAAAEAAEAVSGRRVQIKWVNDLLLDGRKICGILAESKFSQEGVFPEYAAVGIGINLIEPEGGFPPELGGIAGALLPAGGDAEQAFIRCAAGLISALLRYYGGIAKKTYLQGYRERLCVLNRPVTVCENGLEYPAVALDTDDDLRLLVRYADGREEWRSTGEIRISMRNV